MPRQARHPRSMLGGSVVALSQTTKRGRWRQSIFPAAMLRLLLVETTMVVRSPLYNILELLFVIYVSKSDINVGRLVFVCVCVYQTPSFAFFRYRP